MENSGAHLSPALDRNYFIPNSTGTGIAPEKASAILSQFDRKRRAAAIAVPTDDGKVRQQLRGMGEPITLFGEGPGDRRDRLREFLTQQAEAEFGGDGDDDVQMQGMEQEEEDGQADQDEEFYTEGIPELLEARQAMARYSLPRARDRIANQKAESTIPLRTHIKHRKGIKERLAKFDLSGTQIAGERPVSLVRFSPSGTMIAAGSWSGSVKLLDVPSLDESRTLRGHNDRIGGITWFPTATLPSSTVSSASVNLATTGAEGNIHLWSLEQETPISTLSGHTARICRAEFHPSGDYLASASFDTTWRLWDVRTNTQLLLQEGHSREVYAVAFNTDGSLLASGGLDSIGRIWDLRTGRTVMILDGHMKDIYALDWGCDGHRVLSGSGDGFAKAWDLRSVRQAASIGANRGGVTDLRWFKGADAVLPAPAPNPNTDTAAAATLRTSGTFFVSGGFDKNVQIFSADDWALARSLSGHSGNILGVDVSRDGAWITSCGHDRTVKLWGLDDGGGGAIGVDGDVAA